MTHLEHLCQLSKHGTVSIVAETLDESIPPDTNQLSSCRYQECCCDGGNEHLVRFDLINASHPETKASKPSRPGSTCSLPWTIVYLFCWFGLGTAQALCIRPGMYLFVVPCPMARTLLAASTFSRRTCCTGCKQPFVQDASQFTCQFESSGFPLLSGKMSHAIQPPTLYQSGRSVPHPIPRPQWPRHANLLISTVLCE